MIHLTLSFSRALVLGLTLAPFATAQFRWTRLLVTGPGVRTGHAMTSEGETGNVLLFGGSSNLSAALGDLWRFDGVAWQQLDTSGPPARRNFAAAYDSTRSCLVIFGGISGSSVPLADTWEWDGSGWSDRSVPGPVARSFHAMTYDSERRRVVLFGGLGSQPVGDTWEWDGIGWQPRFTVASPPRLHSHAMAFDAHRGKTVLVGGITNGQENEATWEYDGVAWRNAGLGLRRAQHVMSFHPVWKRCVVHGGFIPGFSNTSDSWLWDGSVWMNLPAVATGGRIRSDSAMAFDPVRVRLVMYGGNGEVQAAAAETWAFDAFPAGVTTFGTGCGTPALELPALPQARPRIGATAELEIQNAPLGFAFLAIGTAADWFGGFPLPIAFDGLGMPGCSMLHSADLQSAWFAPATGPTTATAQVPIPTQVSMLGYRLYVQAWALAPGSNDAGVLLSNGLNWDFGDR